MKTVFKFNDLHLELDDEAVRFYITDFTNSNVVDTCLNIDEAARLTKILAISLKMKLREMKEELEKMASQSYSGWGREFLKEQEKIVKSLEEELQWLST